VERQAGRECSGQGEAAADRRGELLLPSISFVSLMWPSAQALLPCAEHGADTAAEAQCDEGPRKGKGQRQRQRPGQGTVRTRLSHLARFSQRRENICFKHAPLAGNRSPHGRVLRCLGTGPPGLTRRVLLRPPVARALRPQCDRNADPERFSSQRLFLKKPSLVLQAGSEASPGYSKAGSERSQAPAYDHYSYSGGGHQKGGGSQSGSSRSSHAAAMERHYRDRLLFHGAFAVDRTF